MSDAASPFQPPDAHPDAARGTLSSERIEQVLGDFHTWLQQWSEPVAPPLAVPEPVDLHTLVGHFIALRQEVNLQTKATRSTLEQNAEALTQNSATLEQLEEVVDELRTAAPAPDVVANEVLKPLLKAIIDVYDVLALSLRQVTRQRDTLRPIWQELKPALTLAPLPDLDFPAETVTPRRGFWHRLFGAKTQTASRSDPQQVLSDWRDGIVQAVERYQEKWQSKSALFEQALDGMITGYSMSLNRIDRLLPQLDLEPMTCIGQPFDPETMEVVEVVTVSGQPAGIVLEEVRRGYRRHDQIYRYAQVRVSK